MIISNNATKYFTDILYSDIIRINVAWIKTEKELRYLVEHCLHKIYLDYPEGRTKPPKPTITLSATINIANEYQNIRYFAISNAESKTRLVQLRKKLREDVCIVPKIETLRGIEHVVGIIRGAKTTTIMLDKDDLYVNCKGNSKIYNQAVGQLRYLGQKHNFKILELQGVIFA